jgi:hypothetical protein
VNGKVVQVVRFIRKLQGSSQPILVEGINGILYVLKFSNNAQGPQVLFNEAAGMQLYRACGLAVPIWEPLLLSKGFIERNRGCWIEGPSGLTPPEPGLCLGTRFLTPSDRILEILPRDSYSRLDNPSCFWMAWLIDVCCNHTDDRQALFAKQVTGYIKAVFIDFGHLFGGPHGTDRSNPMTCMYIDLDIYPYLTEIELERYVRVCRRVTSSKVAGYIKALPSEWQSARALAQFTRGIDLLSNKAFVESMLGQVLKVHGILLRNQPSGTPVSHLWKEFLSCWSTQ